MKRSLAAGPDSFSVAPLLSLLPVMSQTGALQPLSSFFYARFERVAALRRELELQGDSEALRRTSLEQNMLRQMLDWLEISPAPDPQE